MHGAALWIVRLGCAPGFAVILAACSVNRAPAPPGSIYADEFYLPQRAKVGAWAEWKHHLGTPRRERISIVSRTHQEVRVEFRETPVAGEPRVVSARYAVDGSLLDAYEGRPGEVGQPLSILRDSRREEVRRQALRAAEQYGADPESARRRESLETLTVEAGTFECAREDIEASFLFFTGRWKTWRAAQVPFSGIVKMEDAGTGGTGVVMELIGCGWTGAVPELALPAARTGRESR